MRSFEIAASMVAGKVLPENKVTRLQAHLHAHLSSYEGVLMAVLLFMKHPETRGGDQEVVEVESVLFGQIQNTTVWCKSRRESTRNPHTYTLV